MRETERRERRSFSREERGIFIREKDKFYCMIVLLDKKCKFWGDFRKNSRNISGVFRILFLRFILDEHLYENLSSTIIEGATCCESVCLLERLQREDSRPSHDTCIFSFEVPSRLQGLLKFTNMDSLFSFLRRSERRDFLIGSVIGMFPFIFLRNQERFFCFDFL